MTAVQERPVGPEFAYIDETGDTGAVTSRGSTTYTLGCVLVPMLRWTDSLDYFVNLRRNLKSTYGLRMSQEVKANHLVGIKSVYRDLGLGDGQVRDIYRRHIDASVQSCSGVGAIVVHKAAIKKPDIDVFSTAWEYLFTRLRKRTEDRQQPIVIVHDQGEEDRVRKHLRRFRRRNWQGSGYGPAPFIVEDPVPRNSQHSYFIQLADLVSYAASRHAVPAQGRTARICDATMWERLGPIQIKAVSTRSDGIYMWPP
ncbi:DUF3800 domain-containing protein [Mycobacterium canetti]|uniref:DUF3800 domain-containing protein n=1 Tax=Mycobacterium canetti TaxID=78331 RepID=UPI0002A571E8|nr:DUF3800 domain-containing protein [Mycobacterium canetti]CCK65871.1 Protein of unknown function [Mycobacterium canettii CIPT 140070017]